MFSTISSSSSSSSSSSMSIPPDRAFTYLASSEALQQMTQLINPQAPEVPLSLDPEIFFAQFEINTRIFTKQDVELLQRIFQTLKFHPNVCLFDIFGLKFYLLLKELSDSFFIELPAELVEEWEAMYLQAYLNLFRESPINHLPKTNGILNFSVNPKQYYTFLLGFTAKLTAHINENLSEKSARTKSTKLHIRFQKSIESILAEWDSLQKLLGKCLILPQPSLILCDRTLNKTPGAKQMRPQSHEEVLQAGKNLYYYIAMISAAHHANAVRKWTGLYSPYFNELLQELKPLNHLKTCEEILKCAKKCSNLNSQKLSLMQKKLEDLASDVLRSQKGKLSYEMWCEENEIPVKQTKTHESFLEGLIQRYHQVTLESCWLTDCQKVLEESIISLLDPSFHTMQAYENRIHHNLKAIGRDLFTILNPSNDEQRPSEQTNLQKEIHKIKGNFFSCFQFVFKRIDSLSLSLEINYGSLLQDSASLEIIIFTIEKYLEKTLEQLYEIDPDICKGEPLLQELLWLCRIFIFVHDTNHITQATEEKKELDIFPNRFLQFLALEEEIAPGFESFASAASSSESGRDSEEELFSLEPLQIGQQLLHLNLDLSKTLSDPQLSTIDGADRESKLSPAASTHSEPLQNISESSSSSQPKAQGKKKSKATTQEGKPVQRPPLESPPRFPQAIDPRVLLEAKKRRHIEKILKQLGLQPIRTKGSHTVWQHAEDANIQTVVPHHPEIARGTRHAIFEQITGEGV